MKRAALIVFALTPAMLIGCSRKPAKTAVSAPTAYGAAITEVSGGKQVAAAGAMLDQPVVVQVNDPQGNGVTGAYVELHAAADVVLEPAAGLTDSSGQFTSKVTLGGVGGRYQLTAATRDRGGKSYELRLDEIALGYQQILGRQLNQQYCARCHDPESTPERVSNMDNLATKPHAFTDGETLNKISDADLTSIISHGGAALNKSAEMPPYGYTLSKSDIQALLSYIRTVADPPYPTKGVVYAKN
jgi:mono/diheme cytochrome c family protein